MKNFLVFAPSPEFHREPAFRIRILNLQPALLRRGIQLDIRPRAKSPWGRLAIARSARAYDGVLLHRKMLDPYEARALRHSLPRHGRIFMDIDDATMLHERPLGAMARHRLRRRFEATLKILDVACAGNDYLAQIFRDRGIQAAIIPSVVNPVACPVKRPLPDGGATLVWIGSASTLKYLVESFPALEIAAQRVANLKLVVICDLPPDPLPKFPMEYIPWSLATESQDLLRGDIGIAPTPENPWTLGKCGFKIVQYMAAALPVIASPVGFNAGLVQPAVATGAGPTGLLPQTWRDWPAAIEQVAGNVALRQQFGAAGRQRIEQELCVEKIADRWADILA